MSCQMHVLFIAFDAFSISLLHKGLVLTASECPLNFTDFKTEVRTLGFLHTVNPL